MSTGESSGRSPVQASKAVRLYGIPSTSARFKELGDIVADSADSAYHVFMYCGYRLGYTDVRAAGTRLWYVLKADVISTGAVENFAIEDAPVHYYEVNLDASVHEKIVRPISLPDETIREKQSIFAAREATPMPAGTQPPIHEMRQMVEQMIRGGGGGIGGGGGLGLSWGTTGTGNSCATWYTTYYETDYYGGQAVSDANGADCQAEDED